MDSVISTTESNTRRAVSRRTLFRYAGGLSAAMLFSAGLSACGTEQTAKNRRIEAGIAYTLSGGFDPLVASSATAMAVNLHVFEGLVDLHPATREPYAALAAQMPRKIDETTDEATLRDDAVFHDGSPVRPEDVVFSFSRMMDPKNAALMGQFIEFIDKVEVVGPRTVRFHLNRRFPLFSQRISCIKIVPEAIVSDKSSGFNAHPVGSGPYKFVRALKDNRIEFAAHEGYNGPYPPTVDEMIWYLLSDAAARVTAQDSNRVQAIEDIPYLDIDWLKERSDLEKVSSFGLLFMMFNTAKAPFDDPRVRQALHWGLNTQDVIDRGLLGNGVAASSYVQEGHPDYVKASTVYGYDPEKAVQLLKEAGHPTLDFTVVSTDTSWVRDVMPVILESWNKIPGVSVKLRSMQSGALYSQVIDTGEYQVCVAPGDPSVFGNDMDLLLSWYFRGKTWPDKRFHWAGSEKHRRLIEHMDAATATEDRKKALAEWSSAIDILSDEVPLYPIFHRRLPTAWHGNELKNFQPLPTTGLSFLGVERA